MQLEQPLSLQQLSLAHEAVDLAQGGAMSPTPGGAISRTPGGA